MEVRRAIKYSGWIGWYYWTWAFHSGWPVGSSLANSTYDPSRKPLLGFYRGDDLAVLDWQCYWLREYGIGGVILIGSGIPTSDPKTTDHWKWLLFNKVANFDGLGFAMTMPDGGYKSTGSSSAANITADWKAIAELTYFAHPDNAYCISRNGSQFPMIFVWEEASLRGVFDNYNGNSKTLAFFAEMAALFRTHGFGGISVLGRHAIGATETEWAALEADGVLHFEGNYGDDYWNGTKTPQNRNPNEPANVTYQNHVANYTAPIGKRVIASTATSLNSHYPHPSSWRLPGTSPKLFEEELQKAVGNALNHSDIGMEPIATVYNIGEWAEGGPGLQPNQQDRFGYLQAVKNVVLGGDSQVVKPSLKSEDGSAVIVDGAVALAAPATKSCPCDDPRLCQSLSLHDAKAAKPNREVIGLCHWCSFPKDSPSWDALTIMTSGGKDATYEPTDELLCAAHSHGVRFLINHALIPDGAEPWQKGMWFALSQNSSRRADYVARATKFMTHFANGTERRVALDGISFDYESYSTGGINCRDDRTGKPCTCPCGSFGGDTHHWYIPLMAETARSIRSVSPGSIINWDVATNATKYYFDTVACINAPAGCVRGYSQWNMTGLAEIDTVYAMSYGFDESALPAPWDIKRAPNIMRGLTPTQGLEWTVLGKDAIGSIIPHDKLVLGVAWYQMRFQCEGPAPFPGPCKRAGWIKNSSGWFPQNLAHSNFGREHTPPSLSQQFDSF